MDNLPPEKQLIIAILSSIIEDYVDISLYGKMNYDHNRSEIMSTLQQLKYIENYLDSKFIKLYADILSIDFEAYKRCFYKIKNILNNSNKKNEIYKKYQRKHLIFFKKIVANLITQQT